MGAKFPRAIVSEIVAVDVPVDMVEDRRTGEVTAQTAGRRPGSRIDPLGVLRKVEVFKGADGWDVDKARAGKGAKAVRPSEINHGNVAPSATPLGVTCDYVDHRAVLSLAGLRRLAFGGGERDAAGRAVVAGLGLVALAEQDARGYALRSRCDLVPNGPSDLELVHADGSTETFDLGVVAARALCHDAVDAAKRAGLSMRSLTLTPQKEAGRRRPAEPRARPGRRGWRGGGGRVTLALEIELLTGVYRASDGPEGASAVWPPQPDRVFSALTSAWSARGRSAEERAALEWLERQPPPAVRATPAHERSAVDVYVPPNDPVASTKEAAYLQVLPARRSRKPRRFPAARPETPTLSLVWASEAPEGVFAALDAVARDVPYLGHSASLARLRFREADDGEAREARPARRRIYPGRLAELEAAHAADPVRPIISPGAPVRPAETAVAGAEVRWLVLEHVGGEMPDLRAAALVTVAIRRTLMSGYRRTGRGGAVPAAVSGHDADGSPAGDPHLAIAPMAFADFPHADGRVLGFGLIPPAGVALDALPGFVDAWDAVAPYDPALERRVLSLHGAPLRSELRLAPARPGGPRSLAPAPYLGPARRWASVTPMVLDRHLKRQGDRTAEILGQVRASCGRASLPEPHSVRAGKHSAVEGAPSARPSGGGPTWTAWRMPRSTETRWLTHAVIDFGIEVEGPVMLGAGRFHGLGLFRGMA